MSPYLLRPSRTYEEYLRDRAIADRLQKKFEDNRLDAANPAAAHTSGSAWSGPNASSAAPLSGAGRTVTGKTDHRDSANNQT